MKLEVQHPAFKTRRLAVETAGFFRGPRLLVDGAPAERHKGRYSVLSDAGAATSIELKHNFVDPVPKIKIGDELVQVARSLRWYEYLWIGIPVVLLLAGGALGGVIGALATYASARVFRSDRSTAVKYGSTALISIGAFIAFVVLAVLFRQLMGAP